MLRANLKSLFCCFFVASLCLPQVSFGANNEPDAKALRKQASAEFDKKHYQKAYDALQEAFHLGGKTAGALALAGSCLDGLGRYDEALNTYDAVLREFPTMSAELQDKVRLSIGSLLAKVGTVEITGDIPKDARIFIIDPTKTRDLGVSPIKGAVYVLPGSYTIRAEKPPFEPIQTTVVVKAGKQSQAKLAKVRVGKLVIQEKHNWPLHVYVDGEDKGVTRVGTPWESFVEEGEHRIQLKGSVDAQALLECNPPEAVAETGAKVESPEERVVVRFYETLDRTLEAQEMDISLRITSTPAGANLTIDGKDYGPTPWRDRLPPGEHAIEVRSKGFYVAKQKVTLERRKQQELVISLERVPEPPKFWTPRTVGTTVAIGLGLVGLGVFGVTGSLALQNASELKETCTPQGFCGVADEVRLKDTRSLGNAALVGLILGGVGIAAGTSIWLWAPAKETKKDTRERAGLKVNMGLGGVWVEGRF